MPEMNLSVPASAGEVTKEWLKAVLSSSFPYATFTSLECKRIGEIYGFASRIYRYQWQDPGSTRSVVVKLWDIGSKAGLGEVLFYQAFPKVGTRVPNCFYSSADKATKKAVLVLEDLREAVQGDELEQLDLARAKGVARSLAGLHATWLDHPKLAELPWISDVSTWKRESDWFVSRRALFLERFPEQLDGLARLLLDKIEFAPVIANERLIDAPLTLLHGDFHLDNIIFEKQTEPVLIDWSHPVKGAPAYNLVILLLFMTPLKYFGEITDCYLGEFRKHARSTLNRTKLEKQLGGEFLRSFTKATCGVARWQPESERGSQLLDASIRRLNSAANFWQSRDPTLFSFLH